MPTTTDEAAQERATKEALMEKLHLERVSQRGIARLTGMSRSTIIKRQKKTFPPIAQRLTPTPERPILEMDERWSFVGDKGPQVWVWMALERPTRKVVGRAFGDRSADTCRALWQSLPADDRQRAIIYTDQWTAYPAVLPSKRHRPLPKDTGETNHIERLNNTLRQCCANLVRKPSLNPCLSIRLASACLLMT